jgi:hypothetical protein
MTVVSRWLVRLGFRLATSVRFSLVLFLIRMPLLQLGQIQDAARNPLTVNRQSDGEDGARVPELSGGVLILCHANCVAKVRPCDEL